MKQPRKLVVVLHNLRSLHNVGSIFRTADGAGVEKIYLTGFTPAPKDGWGRIRAQAGKVSLGAEEYVAWEKMAGGESAAGVARLIKKLQTAGYVVVALERAARAVPLPRVAKRYAKRDVALVVGSEVDGLPRAVLNRTDAIAEIPMYGRKESLNVAVAAGVALFAMRSGE